jgi:hypothetical protein
VSDTTIGIVCAVLGALILLSAWRGPGLRQRVTSFLMRRSARDRLLMWIKWITGAVLLAVGLLLLGGVIDLNSLRR